MFVNELQEALPPPNHRRGLVAWIRQNLFPNWWNGLLTLVLAYLLLPLLWSALDWAIFSANWQGSSRADCAQGGACWVFIESRLGQYLYGFYPADQYWRINLAFAGLAVLLALYGVPLAIAIRQIRRNRLHAPVGPSWAAGMLVFAYLVSGLTQSMFSHALSTSAYVVLVGLLLGMGEHRLGQPGHQVGEHQHPRGPGGTDGCVQAVTADLANRDRQRHAIQRQ